MVVSFRVCLVVAARWVLSACVFFSAAFLLGCAGREGGKGRSDSIAPTSARGFYFVKSDAGDLVLVVRNAGAVGDEAFETSYRFGGMQNLGDSLVLLSKVPERIVCLSTTHIGFLDALGLASRIVGVSGKEYVTHGGVRDSIASGRVRDVGTVENLNYELLLTLRPDLVLAYDLAGTGSVTMRRLHDMGVPVLLVGEFKEKLPLGRAEWIRPVGFITGRMREADSVFGAVSQRYQALAASMDGYRKRPKVLLNAPWRDAWYVPGQDSYMAHLIGDAGGSLLSPNNFDSDSHSISFEAALHLGMQAEYWLHPGTCETLHEVRALHEVFGGFPSVQIRQVYNNTKRMGPGGGNAFWEQGVIEPDRLLHDLIRIFHPQVSLQSDTLYYYKRLR